MTGRHSQIVHSFLRENSSKLLKFSLVGLIGTGINFLTYYAITEMIGLNLNVGAIGAFCVAITSNYILNHEWTFSIENHGRPINFMQFTYYIAGNLVGLGVNLLVLNILVALAGTTYHLIWQAIGIFSGMIFNFLFAKKLVFKIANSRIS
mgnify:CR=1 FL=1|jgi:putative flippase GtrA